VQFIIPALVFLEHLLFSKVQRVLLNFHSFTRVADNEVSEMFADVPPRVSEWIGMPQGHKNTLKGSLHRTRHCI